VQRVQKREIYKPDGNKIEIKRQCKKKRIKQMENKWILKNKYKYKANNINVQHKHQNGLRVRTCARDIYVNTDSRRRKRQLEIRET